MWAFANGRKDDWDRKLPLADSELPPSSSTVALARASSSQRRMAIAQQASHQRTMRNGC